MARSRSSLVEGDLPDGDAAASEVGSGSPEYRFSRLRRVLQRDAVLRTVGAVATTLGAILLAGVLTGGDAKPEAPVEVKPEVPVTATNQAVAAANNSPSLAADPTEPRFVVIANRRDAPDFGCDLQVSGDGGRGWLSVVPVRELPPGVDKCYAPEVAFDADGTLYYLFVGLEGAGNQPTGAFLTISRDRGRTFTTPHQVLGPRNFGVRMAIDRTMGERGRMHMVWLHTTSDPPTGGFGPPPNPILAAHSDDGGQTFSEPIQVSDVSRERVVAPALALGPDHAVHVAYFDLGRDAVDYQGLEGPAWEGTWSLVTSRSTDGGAKFQPGVVVDENLIPNERVMLIFTMPPPALAADKDRLCAAWSDGRNGDADAFVRCSLDGGRNWEPLHRLNDDAVGNGRSQYLPALALSPGGRVDAIFYDRRSNVENLANDVYYTYSIDGARSFAANVRVTREGSDSRIGQQYAVVSARGQVEFGSRLALLARSGSALMAWTDTRNSKPETTAQDLFATEIVFPTADGASGRAGAAGSILLAAGLVAMVATAVRGRGKRGTAAAE